MKINKRMTTGLLLVAILLATITQPVWGQNPITRMRNVVITILTVAGGLTTDDLTATDDAVVSDDLTVADNIAGNDLIVADFESVTPQTSLLLVMNGWITPTGTIQPIRAAGAVSINSTSIAPGFSGQELILVNYGANAVTITETAPNLMAGNIAIGTGDNITLVYSGTAWIELARVNN